MACIYWDYNNKAPCCTHQCDGCTWNDEYEDEEELIRIAALKRAREKIELAGQRGQKEQYHVDGECGDHGWLHYCKGIRDACWAIDAMIKELEGTNERNGL